MKFKIITLSGSITKVYDTILQVAETLSTQGNIVLMPFRNTVEDSLTAQQKKMHEVLHEKRIDISDQLYVVNKDGYIGKSTRNEILYAMRNRKDVEFLERPSVEYMKNLLLTLSHFQRIDVLQIRFKSLMTGLISSLYYHYFLSEDNKYDFIHSTSDINKFQTDIDLLFEFTKHSTENGEEFNSEKFYRNTMIEVYDDIHDTLAEAILSMLPNMKVDFGSVISCSELTVDELVYSTPSELIARLKNK